MITLLRYKKPLKIFFWFWILFIAVVSSLPNIPTQEINIWDEPFRLDYLEHFGVFYILSAIYVAWKADKKSVFSFRKHFSSLLLLGIFAILDEIHQIWIPGRAYNPLDLIYNLSGLIAGILLTKLALTKYIAKTLVNK
jgi:VanZ family protein